MKFQILLQKEALHELMLRLETIENEVDIDHGMVLLLRYLNIVTQHCANLNNTDQIFLDFTNTYLSYDGDDDENLLILVYSGINNSMGP